MKRRCKVVLMYHDIVTSLDTSSGFQNDSAFQYKVAETAFEEQVRALQGRDIEFTFDDGGVSFLTIAAPILEKYGFKGVFFISTNYIGSPGFLTKEQVRELFDRGHKIGSHTHTHPDSMKAMELADIGREWKESVEVLSDITGHIISTASIPNGNGDKRVFEEAKKAGINSIYTSVPTENVQEKDGINVIGRYVVHDDTSTEMILKIANDTNYRRKKYIKWMVINVVKFLLGSSYKKVKSIVVKQI